MEDIRKDTKDSLYLDELNTAYFAKTQRRQKDGRNRRRERGKR